MLLVYRCVEVSATTNGTRGGDGGPWKYPVPPSELQPTERSLVCLYQHTEHTLSFSMCCSWPTKILGTAQTKNLNTYHSGGSHCYFSASRLKFFIYYPCLLTCHKKSLICSLPVSSTRLYSTALIFYTSAFMM